MFVSLPVADQSRDVLRQAQYSCASVRSVSDIPPFVSCGLYPEAGIVGIHCQDSLLDTDYVIEVQFNGDGSLVQVATSAVRDEEIKRMTSRLVDNDVTMKSRGAGFSGWVMAVRAARDLHEQNTEVFRDSGGQLRMRTIRPVRAGDELLVWYGEERARECGVPILTPLNIQGNQQYTCTQCSKCFRFPNSLKSHLLFHCRRPPFSPSNQPSHHLFLPTFISTGSWQQQQLRSDLWRAFCTTLPVQSTTTLPTFQTLELDLTKNSNINGTSTKGKLSGKLESVDVNFDKSPDNQTADNCATNQRTNFHLINTLIAKNDLSPSYLTNGTCPNYFWNEIPGLLRHPIADDRLDAAAQRHLLTSTMCGILTDSKNSCQINERSIADGFSKTRAMSIFELDEIGRRSGDPMTCVTDPMRRSTSRSRGPCHTCVYCGKIYSRKYGLTIHLRTHSGYKPLKCKVCMRPFGDPSNLNKHVRLHAAGDTPYRCRYCGKVLVRRRDLDRHIRSRHPNDDDGVRAIDDVTIIST